MYTHFIQISLLFSMFMFGYSEPLRRESPPIDPLDFKLEDCVHDGVTYTPGEKYQKTPCERCECSGWGFDFCNSLVCEPPVCPDNEYSTREGACCPSCDKEWPNGIGPEYPVPQLLEKRWPPRRPHP